jgi:hypothetical protein
MAKRKPGKKPTRAKSGPVARARKPDPRGKARRKDPKDRIPEPVTTWNGDVIPDMKAPSDGDDIDAAPAQAQLFELAKPFNFTDAWLAIETQQVVIDDLTRIHEEDATKAKRSKKALDEARAALGQLVNTLKGRRLQKERDGSHWAARCLYESETGQSCPICTAESAVLVIAAIGGSTTVRNRWTDAHRLAADAITNGQLSGLVDLMSDELVAQALGIGGWFMPWEGITAWTIDERKAALAWVDCDMPADVRPPFVGLPHIAADVEGAIQHCAVCDHILNADLDSEPSYPLGARVGTLCPGAMAAADAVSVSGAHDDGQRTYPG